MSDSAPAPSFPEILAELSSPAGASPASLHALFRAILAGTWPPAQVAGALIALRLLGETTDTFVAGAKAMREVMVRVPHEFAVVLDTCGTGGDHSRTLNLSTGAALIAAGAGVAVAKHGNRAATSQSGSADVLEALGVALDVPPHAQSGVLREAGIAFLFAQAHHPAMRNTMPIRRELGVRTILNCLGPLSNPASATHQLIGTFDDVVRPKIANALVRLGTVRAWVVRSADGMDELSPHGVTRVSAAANGTVEEFEVTPEDFGLRRSPAGAIAGSDPASNARALEEVLSGAEHPASDAFVLNAAAALVVAEGLEPKIAAQRAREVLRSGAALARLNLLRQATASAPRG